MEDAGFLDVNHRPIKVGQPRHYDGSQDGNMKEHLALRSNNYGDVGPEPRETSTTHSDANPGGAVAGSSTLNAIPLPTSETADSFEIPETPSATELLRCPVDPEVVRVMGKRTDTGRAGYLVLCWMYPYEGEAVASDSARCFRDYDQKIVRDAVRHERLSALWLRKRSRSPES